MATIPLVMRMISAVLLLLVGAGVARADIYTWRDGDGVRHFTNIKDQVPAETGAAAKVFVSEPPASPMAAAPAVMPPPQPAPEPRQATVVYDRDTLEAAYARGWAEGMERAQGMEGAPAAPVSVQINGPFVASSGGGAPGPYWYSPLVTTSFDRGRSRHMTLRMLLQDQFAIDREGPFTFDERFFPPNHHVAPPPNLHPFLTRGLTHVPPPSQRVIAR